MRVTGLSIVLFLAGTAVQAADCKVREEASPWTPVAVAGLQEGVTVAWRKSTGLAFGECLTSVKVRISNDRVDETSVALHRCVVAGDVAAGPSGRLGPGGKEGVTLSLRKVSRDVSDVRCYLASGDDIPVQWLRKVEPGSAEEAELTRKIARHLAKRAFRANPKVPIKASTRIQSALKALTDLREEPGMSVIPQLRNAEYYFHALYSGTAGLGGDPAHLATTAGAPVYELYKRAAFAGGFEAWLRANPQNPMSAPGGSEWAWAGLRDGVGIKDAEVEGASPRFEGELPGLREPPKPAMAPAPGPGRVTVP